MYEVLTFLYAFNYHNYGFLVAAVIVFFLLNQNDFSLTFTSDPIFRYLLVGSVVFMGLSLRYYGMPLLSSFVNLFIAPMILFVYGYMLAMDEYDRFQRNVIVMAFATFLHGLLNIIMNINVDVLSRVGRSYMDIGGELIAATLQNLFFVMPAALLFYFAVCYRENMTLKAGGILMALCGVWGSIMNASRTVILLTGLLFFFAMAIYLYCENEFLDTAVLKMAGAVIALASMALVIYQLNLFDLKARLANSALGKRSESTSNDLAENARWKYAGDILKSLPFYLMGNNPYPHFAHNLWVDTAKQAGVIPFAAYIMVVWKSIKKLAWLVRSSLFSSREKVVIAPIVAGLVFIFFTEPILQGAPMYFALFCFISGGLTCMTDCAEEMGMLDR